MATVLITPAAQGEFSRLPLPIQGRLRAVFVRLEKWPNVSGVKPLRGGLAGNYRIRTGDYRVIFRVEAPDGVIIWRIGYRGDVYDD
jgi:mRNA-degrading endonuclease RelE of RelBE toxin-antitoxin system